MKTKLKTAFFNPITETPGKDLWAYLEDNEDNLSEVLRNFERHYNEAKKEVNDLRKAIECYDAKDISFKILDNFFIQVRGPVEFIDFCIKHDVLTAKKPHYFLAN